MKKVLSIVLSIAMVLCMMPAMAFAGTTSAQTVVSYSDTEGTACEGAVNVLSALGVVNGYSDGTYKPEQVVTRAEMAKLIVSALNVAEYSSATTSRYTDMGGAEWAIPVVERASDLGIINGYGYGLFGPNDTVTYEQAVTMIVRALGYTTDCNEMKGTYPSVFVKKATDLGIFDDVQGNVYGVGANRGDVAIMLFNALELPLVYADGDGATNYRTGNVPFAGLGLLGSTLMGTDMYDSLNKNAQNPEYKIIDNAVIDASAYDITKYEGTLAKVYYNKDDDVIALGDIKTTLLTGTFNSDRDKFTADGKEYRIDSSALSKFDSSTGNASDAASAENAKKLSDGVAADLTVLNSTTVNENQTYTIAAIVKGTTVSKIFAVSEWTKDDPVTFVEESDITSIKNKNKIAGKEFPLDNNGDIDYTKFILKGVDKVEDIAEKNVVYVYSVGNKIRKLEVGTETVTGTIDAIQSGAEKAAANVGKSAKITIGGTAYETAIKGASLTDITPNASTREDIALWYTPEGDTVDLGDSVVAYLDASGKIYTFKLDEAASSSYALVLDYDVAYKVKDGKIVISNEDTLNGNDSKIKVLTAEGDVTTYAFKNNAEVFVDDVALSSTTKAGPRDDISDFDDDEVIALGSIVKVDINSNGNVKKVNIVGGNNGESGKISASGYFDGQAIATNATIFTRTATALTANTHNGMGSDTTQTVITSVDIVTIPQHYVDSDNVDVASYESVLGSDTTNAYWSVTKNNKYAALVLADGTTSKELNFGIVTSYRELSKDDASGCKYSVTMLMNGATDTVTKYWDGSSAPAKGTLYQVKYKANGEISSLDTMATVSSGSNEAETLGRIVVDGTNNKANNNVVNGVTIASDAIYYVDDEGWTVGSKADLVNAATGTYVYLVETGKALDRTGVANVVIIGGTTSKDAAYGNAISFATPKVATTGSTPGSYDITVSPTSAIVGDSVTVTVSCTTDASGGTDTLTVTYTGLSSPIAVTTPAAGSSTTVTFVMPSQAVTGLTLNVVNA